MCLASFLSPLVLLLMFDTTIYCAPVPLGTTSSSYNLIQAKLSV